MKSYLFIFRIILIIFLTTSCSEDDPIEDKVLFTYTSEDPSKAQLILLDTDGNLIDNQKVSNQLAELNGPSNIDRFTVVNVDTTTIGRRPTIQIFVNVNQSEWKKSSIAIPNKGNLIDVKIASELQNERLVISGEHRRIYTAGSLDNSVNASIEDKIVLIWNEIDKTPKFASYSDLSQDFMELNVSAADFSEMSYQDISSIPSDAYLYWHLGRTNTSQQNRYDLMDVKSIDVTDGYYYPAGLFDFWYTGFGFNDNNPNEAYYTDYYGERPSTVTKLDIGTITHEITLPMYNVNSSNQSVDVIVSLLKSYNAEMTIYSKNGETVPFENLFNTLKDLYPELELSTYVQYHTWFYEIDGWEYDDFIKDKLSSDGLSNDIKSWKYYYKKN